MFTKDNGINVRYKRNGINGINALKWCRAKKENFRTLSSYF